MQAVLTLTPAEAKALETTYRVVRRSVDARQKNIKVNLTLLTDERGQFIPLSSPLAQKESEVNPFKALAPLPVSAPEVTIVGSGPAGLFAALTLLENGIRPIILERGKSILERKKDIALLNRNAGFNAESNYCFGEGGAGTFSDGKLFSRSKKRGNMQRVMEIFHYFGAPDTVLYETHAHIGSDHLPSIIQAMREYILAHGGEIHFGQKWEPAKAQEPLILAIGHSAHDTYRALATSGIALEAKGWAMGVRVEHPQALINRLMYHTDSEQLVSLLGAAAYSVVTQVNGRGVYSFCMCPGGHIVPAASEPESCVVNGMSASHRNSPFANSGMVVQIPPMDSPLQALAYQEALEHEAFLQAPNALAPAQRLCDFVHGKTSVSLPACSYLPGIAPSRLDKWLPKEIGTYLRQGFRDFDRKYKGFLTNEAVVVGVESRTSTPVRIVRDTTTRQSVSHPWLYPCGEGAGYAGGITSSALDGIETALKVAERIKKLNSREPVYPYHITPR